MKIVVQYLKEKKGDLTLFIAMMLMFDLIFYLYDINLEPLLYIYILLFGVVLVRVIYGFVQFYKKHQILVKHAALDEIYVLDMEKSKKTIERDYQILVNKLIAEKTASNAAMTKTMTEMKDYYTLWAHQIKTPISAMNLLLQVIESNGENDCLGSENTAAVRTTENYQKAGIEIKELRQELFKIDFYADAVLQYLRLEDISSDFKFDKYNLESIVKQSVKKYAFQFIYRKIKIEMSNLDFEVLTDEKWISFVIEQLLSNAIKYTKDGGTVKIYRKETFNVNDKILVIEDNGIGISDEDLPRIFERGFTGYNGRIGRKSTGIGLYLCKKAINKLSYKIAIESEYGVGTKVIIDMSGTDMRHE